MQMPTIDAQAVACNDWFSPLRQITERRMLSIARLPRNSKHDSIRVTVSGVEEREVQQTCDLRHDENRNCPADVQSSDQHRHLNIVQRDLHSRRRFKERTR